MCVHVHTRAYRRTSLLHDIVHRACNSCQRTGRIAQNQFYVFKLSILWITLLKRGWQQGEVLGSQGNTIATCYTCTDANIVIIFQLHCISIHMYACRQGALLRPVKWNVHTSQCNTWLWILSALRCSFRFSNSSTWSSFTPQANTRPPFRASMAARWKASVPKQHVHISVRGTLHSTCSFVFIDGYAFM